MHIVSFDYSCCRARDMSTVEFDQSIQSLLFSGRVRAKLLLGKSKTVSSSNQYTRTTTTEGEAESFDLLVHAPTLVKMAANLRVTTVRHKLIGSVLYWWSHGDSALNIMQPCHPEFVSEAMNCINKTHANVDLLRLNLHKAESCFCVEDIEIPKPTMHFVRLLDREYVLPQIASSLNKHGWWNLLVTLYEFLASGKISSSHIPIPLLLQFISPAESMMECCEESSEKATDITKRCVLCN